MLLVAVLAGLSILLGGCGGVVGSVLSTRQGVDGAGFSDTSVSVSSETNVKVTTTVHQDYSDAQVHEIAAIVWRDFHERFDLLEITLHATDRTVSGAIPFAVLQLDFGARSSADNATTIRSGIIRFGLEVVIGAVVVVLVIVFLVVVLVRRRRRHRVGPPGPGARGPGAPPGSISGSGPDAPWGPPVAAPNGLRDPWQPPPGSGPSAW